MPTVDTSKLLKHLKSADIPKAALDPADELRVHSVFFSGVGPDARKATLDQVSGLEVEMRAWAARVEAAGRVPGFTVVSHEGSGWTLFVCNAAPMNAALEQRVGDNTQALVQIGDHLNQLTAGLARAGILAG